MDVKLAATWGTQLQLVEAQGNAVRFPHSILQAYLGSRLIGHAMADADFRAEALKNAGRELLIALVMHSRATMKQAGRRRPADSAVDCSNPPAESIDLRSLLREEARKRSDAKAFDLYATALEIDSVDSAPEHRAIAKDIARHWQKPVERDPRTLEHAKLNLVRRFGEAARTMTERRSQTDNPARPVYRRNWEKPGERDPRTLEHAKLNLVRRFGEAARTTVKGLIQTDDPAKPAYRQLFDISCSESSYPVRLAAAYEIGTGGDDALAELADTLRPDLAQRNREQAGTNRRARTLARQQNEGETARANAEQDQKEQETQRREIMCAWLVPLLVGSATLDWSRDIARGLLRSWLDSVYAQHRRTTRERFGLSLEIALAQGFKYAANRRRGHPHAPDEARSYLAEQAKEMLGDCHFWFTRLTLLHALTLWQLPDGADQRSDHRGDPDYKALVAHWCGMAGYRRRDRQNEHPFVAEARRLAVRALETGQPERYIWIDESGVVSRVGSSPARPGRRRKHNLWIPPSTGWTALNAGAQQLVADVLLLLNLAERDERRDQGLQRTNRNYLPPCIAEDRSPLKPNRPLGIAGQSASGSSCVAGCQFSLCPYPSKGAQHHRQELSEAFCRRQQRLLTLWPFRPRSAPWQEMSPARLRRFWRELGQPAPRSEPESDGVDQSQRRDRRRKLLRNP